jgi:hypothetical protein
LQPDVELDALRVRDGEGRDVVPVHVAQPGGPAAPVSGGGHAVAVELPRDRLEERMPAQRLAAAREIGLELTIAIVAATAMHVAEGVIRLFQHVALAG